MTEKKSFSCWMKSLPISLVTYVQGLTADEDADDAYCEQLYQNYLKDPDRGQTFTEDEVCKQLGIAL